MNKALRNSKSADMIPYHTTPFSNHQVQLDLTQLNILSSDDPSFKNQVLKMMRAQAQEIADELERALEKADWTAVADASHKFKSSVNIINQQAHNQFKVLEKEAREGVNSQDLEHKTQHAINLCMILANTIEQELEK